MQEGSGTYSRLVRDIYTHAVLFTGMVLSVWWRTFHRIIRSLATVFQLNCLILVLSVHECRHENILQNDLIFNTSRLLNDLLRAEKYDKEIRPGFGVFPTVIITDIEIRSFGPVSETQMIYSMDCYFRQTWWDPRLKFQTLDLDILSLDWKFLQKVWTPDTYFLNGRYSYLHKVTVPNKFVRLRSDGQMKYSMRLTIQASCPMLLRKYPLDTQSCPLEIGSFAYPPTDVMYKWKGKKPVIIAEDVTLSQYEFLNITFEEITKRTGGGTRSSLVSRFILRRRRGYFILQIYAPCAMIVGASWVSFWINSQDAPARVAVGVTTILTLVAMGFGGMTSIQRATSGSALDWFVILCFTFVFAAMAEYACVNLLDRYETEKTESKKRVPPKINKTEEEVSVMVLQLENDCEEQNSECHEFHQNVPKRPQEESKENDVEMGSSLDSYARFLFPLIFTIINILYWTFFLYISDDDIHPDHSNIKQNILLHS